MVGIAARSLSVTTRLATLGGLVATGTSRLMTSDGGSSYFGIYHVMR
jgi:hypothetical protein